MFKTLRIRQREVPPAPTIKVLQQDTLLGIDLHGELSAVSISRSPNCTNMLRSTPGKVEKRPGYRCVANYDGRINGAYELDGHQIIHAGNALYCDDTRLTPAVNDAKSSGAYFNHRLYLLDGEEYWCLAPGQEGALPVLSRVSDNAYTPCIAVSKNPDGSGGSELEDVNLLSDAWTESFYGTATDTGYHLEFDGLNEVPVKAKKLKADGVSYLELAEGTDFSVNREAGIVTFALAPGKSPAEGEDNVIITASRDRSAQRRKVTKADVMVTYGEAGSRTRLFVTGDPDYKNRDFWSESNDPTYFSDLSYSVLGPDNERILGYSLLGDSLAAHKGSRDGTIYVRKGTRLTDKDAAGNVRNTLVFATGNVITGFGALSLHSFAVMGDEPLFLTALGVYALTPSDLTGARYQQSRSYYIDPALQAEPALDEAEAVVWKDFYILAVGEKLYCLDSLQKSYAANAPQSAYQYECFVLTDIPARRLWTRDGQLYFGTETGKVCRFCSGSALSDYMDSLGENDMRPIHAVWETPYLNGDVFYRFKNFRSLALHMKTAPLTSAMVSALQNGQWCLLRSGGRGGYLAFSQLKFSRMTFRCDRTGNVLRTRLHLKKLAKVRFRFENNAAEEPFGLIGWAVEYT